MDAFAGDAGKMTEMRIAVCSADEREIARICSLLDVCAAAVRRRVTAEAFRSEDRFREVFRPGYFYGVAVCYGDVRGFLLARSVREQDSGCRMILLDDTERYAIRGLRIHIDDFLVRPIDNDRLRAALLRLLTD